MKSILLRNYFSLQEEQFPTITPPKPCPKHILILLFYQL